MQNIFVRSNKGELYHLNSFVMLNKKFRLILLKRFNLFQAAKVSGQPAAGYGSEML